MTKADLKREYDNLKNFSEYQRKQLRNGEANYKGLANSLRRIKGDVEKLCNTIANNNEFLITTTMSHANKTGVIMINNCHIDQIERSVRNFSIPEFDQEDLPF